MRELRLLPRESLHATLVFLGHQAERDVDRIAELSLTTPPAAFELRPGEAVALPPRRPRLYALGLEEPREELREWQAGLSARLAGAGLYEPEKRPFWAHVTLGRVKRGANAPRMEPLPELPADLRRPFLAERLTLFKSTLTPSGAVYEALRSEALPKSA
jgi:2'-5' RNA ligase